MNSFKIALLATACAVAMSTSAFAAAAEPAMDAGNSIWAGPYVGIQLGGASATTEHTDLDDWYNDSKDFGTTDGAFIGGAKIGYDWMNGSTIYGLFAEYSFSGIDTEKETTNGTDYSAGSDIKGLGSVRAKLGMATGDVSGAISVGLGYQNADDKYTETDGSGQTIDANSDKLGWAFGLGTEYSVGNNATIGLDASHYVFGKKTHELQGLLAAGNFFTFQNTVSTGTISYNYKF